MERKTNNKLKLTICTLFILCIGFPQILVAQNGFEIGPRLIPNYSFILNIDDYKSSTKYIANFGLNYGFEIAYSLDEYLSVRSGYYHIVIGDTYVQGNVLIQKWIKYNKIPIVLKLNSEPYDGRLISFYFGPQLAFINNAEHLHAKYCKAKEARKDNPIFTILDKPIEEEQMPYEVLYGAGLHNTEYLYKDRMVDIVFGMGMDWPLNAFFLLNTAIMLEVSSHNIEDRKEVLRGEPFWTTYWGNEKRSPSLSTNLSLQLGLTYVFKKRLLFKLFRFKKERDLEPF